jgi:hypothetical protein
VLLFQYGAGWSSLAYASLNTTFAARLKLKLPWPSSVQNLQCYHRGAMWLWKRKSVKEGFPLKFRVQRIGIDSAKAVSHLPPQEIAAYFRNNPLTAERLLAESYDKRYSPSSFIAGEDGGYQVGWYSDRYECVRRFSNLADAATDYLLFSLGKGRWMPPQG